nr:MAG TPA: hypothetical protein [Bacteriophage sp.]
MMQTKLNTIRICRTSIIITSLDMGYLESKLIMTLLKKRIRRKYSLILIMLKIM